MCSGFETMLYITSHRVAHDFVLSWNWLPSKMYLWNQKLCKHWIKAPIIYELQAVFLWAQWTITSSFTQTFYPALALGTWCNRSYWIVTGYSSHVHYCSSEWFCTAIDLKEEASREVQNAQHYWATSHKAQNTGDKDAKTSIPILLYNSRAGGHSVFGTDFHS